MMKGSVRLYGMLLLVAVLGLSLQSCGGGGGGGGGVCGGTPVAEGIDSPVPLTLNTTRCGKVDTYASFYIASVTQGAKYTINVTGMTDDADLFVFDSPTFSNILCWSWNSGTADEQCNATATATGQLHIVVDGMNTTAGTFYDITVTPALPAAPTGVIALAGDGQVTISWSSVTDAASYNLYYSETSGDGKGGTKIIGVTSPYVHTGRTNGTTYYYVVTSVNANGESVASSQVSATPMTPLVSINFDDGTLQNWSATGTWAVTNAYSYSGSYSVTDSPGGSYPNNTDTLLQSPLMDLTGTAAPSLSFYHRYQTESCCDYGYVEVSTDGGQTFSNLRTYSGTLSTFTPVVIDLSLYKTSTVVLRFRLHTDVSLTYDGWYIDDIVVMP